MAAPSTKKPRLTLGINYADRVDTPPSGLEWYKVKTGESLGSIADQFGITWMDLALINFRTLDQAEINWYLYHYTGCRTAPSKWYVFSSADSPGKILVPSISGTASTGQPRRIGAVRDGTATRDSKLEVEVYERTRTMELLDIAGKWLYVFSAPEISFGYSPPSPVLITSGNGEISEPSSDSVPLDVQSDPSYPGSAFTGQFPGGQFCCDKGPDRLEYEIFVTSEECTSKTFLDTIGGSGTAERAASDLKFGKSWYFLSDQAILGKAGEDGRETRNQHAYRNQKFVTLELAPNAEPRRYYFLLSPVQLGPNALRYAAQHPEGLTPFRDPTLQTTMWECGDENVSLDVWQGPTAEGLSGRVRLGVVDPFAWAESIAEDVIADSVGEYSRWIDSKRNRVLSSLNRETGWTTDHYYLASLLQGARDRHPDPASIDNLLKDAATFKKHLERWRADLFDKNAILAATATRDVIELRKWMSSSAHRIIETAIMKDTDGTPSWDAVDLARGLLHYGVCFENIHVTPDGANFIIEELDRKDSIPHRLVWKDFKDLGHSTFKVEMEQRELTACRYASGALIGLLGLRFFVEPEDVTPRGMTPDAFHRNRNQQLAEMFNGFSLMPAKLGFLPNTNTSNAAISPAAVRTLALPGPGFADYVNAGGTALVGILDVTDKLSSWVVESEVVIDKQRGVFHRLTGSLEDWLKATPGRERWANGVNKGSSYGLKGCALAVTLFNLHNTIAKARFDYQHSVSGMDWLNSISCFTLAIQDIVAEVASISGSARLAQWFPGAFTTASTDAAGWGGIAITSTVGKVFASANVVAMLVAGATTTYSSAKGFAQARSNGSTSAAAWYGVATVGGVVMTAGAMTLAYSLWVAGGAFSATGAGVTVGIVLFAVGGVIAAIATLAAVFSGDDDLQVFARKCTFGLDGTLEPRFPTTLGMGGPPGWSHATNAATNSWPLDKQRRALFNILCRFTVTTEVESDLDGNDHYRGSVRHVVKPQLLLPGALFTIALEHGSEIGTAKFAPPRREPLSFATSKSTLMSAPLLAQYRGNGTAFSELTFVCQTDTDCGDDEIVSLVTLTFPGQDVVLRCRKGVIKDGYLSDAFTDTIQSDLYD